MSKTTQEEAERRVNERCKERNFGLVEPFIYTKSQETILHIKCNTCNDDWPIPYVSFVRDGGCRNCSGKLPYTNEEILDKINKKCKDKNYELLDINYNGNKTRVYLKCNNDENKWDTSFNDFINRDTNCSICSWEKSASSKRLTYDEALKNILDRCKEMNYSLFKPLVYKNNDSIIQLYCNECKNDWPVRYKKFINIKRGCPTCNGGVKFKEEFVLKQINEKCKRLDYIILKPFIYENQKSKLYLRCDKHDNEWNPSYQDFIYKDGNCSVCSGVYMPTQEEAEAKVLNQCDKNNYILLEPFKYIDVFKTILSLNCKKCDCKWKPNYANFINHNTGCPDCGKEFNKNELKFKKFLENNNIEFIHQYRTEWLKRLSIDFYLPKYNIAIEHNGRQHFKSEKFFGGIEGYLKNVERDKKKFELCKEHNIELLYFTYEKNLNTDNYFEFVYKNDVELLNIILNKNLNI